MKRIYAVLSWIIAFLILYSILMTSVRALISPAYLNFEYNKPDFPVDTYGFSKADRLKWATISIDYLVNQEDLTFLSERMLDASTPLYNERELSHMLDVKNLVQTTLRLFYAALVLLLGLGIWAWRGQWLKEFWRGVSRGGWITIGLILTILLFVMISFDQLFTQFHHLFFTGDTWLFFYSDSLIRLFPMIFWQDAFVLMGVFSLAAGIILGFAGRKLAQTAKS